MKRNTVTDVYYENVEISFATAQADIALSGLATTFKSKFFNTAADPDLASSVVIRTSQTIGIRLNKSTNDLITISSTDGPYEISGIKVNEIYLTNNSGSTAAIRLFFQPTKY